MGVFEDVIAQSSRKPNGLSGVLERRKQPRAPTLRSSSTGMTSHLWELELVPAFALIRLGDDIDRLTRDSVDQNIFFETTILRSAWPRLTNLLAPHGAWMLCLWETIGAERKMRLFMPVRRNRIGFPRKTVLQPLSNDYTPLGTPLIDQDCAAEAAETLLRLLSDSNLNLPGILDFTHLRTDSKTFGILHNAAKNLGLRVEKNSSYHRAALLNDGNGVTPNWSKKRTRELARQKRKLTETGDLKFHVAKEQDDILDAFERFMTLELRGWKGRKGTALYNHKKIAAFSRQIVASLAINEECRIYSLDLDGKMIAGGILLGHHGKFMPWKIAFDEAMAQYSPGMQLMVHITEELKGSKSFVEADSLAVADHWMMNRVWESRIPIADLSISLAPRYDSEIEGLVLAKTRLKRAKDFARPYYRKFRETFDRLF